MRRLWAALLIPVFGCASTVSRLPGELSTPSGSARNPCESSHWLVLAPTQSQEVTESGRSSKPRTDGFGAYEVGAAHPEKIPGLAERLGSSPIIDRHRAGVERHDQKQLLAGGLGAAGLIALGIGSYLFATSFDTQKKTASDGTVGEEQKINGGRIAGGSLLIAAGFGLGIAGIVVSPNAGERARADQKRYVFTPPEDEPEVIKGMIDDHNREVRDRCAAHPTAAGE